MSLNDTLAKFKEEESGSSFDEFDDFEEETTTPKIPSRPSAIDKAVEQQSHQVEQEWEVPAIPSRPVKRSTNSSIDSIEPPSSITDELKEKNNKSEEEEEQNTPVIPSRPVRRTTTSDSITSNSSSFTSYVTESPSTPVIPQRPVKKSPVALTSGSTAPPVPTIPGRPASKKKVDVESEGIKDEVNEEQDGNTKDELKEAEIDVDVVPQHSVRSSSSFEQEKEQDVIPTTDSASIEETEDEEMSEDVAAETLEQIKPGQKELENEPTCDELEQPEEDDIETASPIPIIPKRPISHKSHSSKSFAELKQEEEAKDQLSDEEKEGIKEEEKKQEANPEITPIIPRRPTKSKESTPLVNDEDQADKNTANSVTGETKDHPTIPSQRPLKPIKPLSRTPTSDEFKEAVKSKPPPPKPKKPSSKIAAFQEILRKNQEAELAKSQPQSPTSRSGSPVKAKEEISGGENNRTAFKQSLNGLFALPGMVRPGAALPKVLRPPTSELEEEPSSSISETESTTKEAEEEEEEEAKKEVKDARKSRARGPRGKRLPKAVSEAPILVIEDKRTVVVSDFFTIGGKFGDVKGGFVLGDVKKEEVDNGDVEEEEEEDIESVEKSTPELDQEEPVFTDDLISQDPGHLTSKSLTKGGEATTTTTTTTTIPRTTSGQEEISDKDQELTNTVSEIYEDESSNAFDDHCDDVTTAEESGKVEVSLKSDALTGDDEVEAEKEAVEKENLLSSGESEVIEEDQ